MSEIPPQYGFVTLVTSDYYLPGALVVAAALRELHPSPPSSTEELDPREFHIISLVTPETVSVQTLRLLRKIFDVVIGVEVIEEDTQEALELLGRPDLKTVLTKLHVFRLKSYRKIIYLDADVLPLLPISHLFHQVSSFAAVPDAGWPDIFNSGVFAFKPGEDDFDQIMGIVRSEGSWDGGDQGVLNEWRRNDWERLSFIYNTTPTAAYTYAPAYKRFGSEIKVIHFIGPDKPWSQAPFRTPTSTQSIISSADDSSGEHSLYAYSSLLDRWFAVFDKYYRSTAPIFTATGSLIPTATFAEGTYENAWDSGVRPISNGIAPLGLVELRKLALQGLGKTPTIEPGEGAYMTLPLDGRLDLMPLQRSKFCMPSSVPMALSCTSMDLADSQSVETPVDELAGSISRLSFSSRTHHEESRHPGLPFIPLTPHLTDRNKDITSNTSVPWDPWTRPYTNAWDLLPGIVQRYAYHSTYTGWRSGHKAEMVNTQERVNPTYRRLEDNLESTSADGDDEAEDGDC